MALKFPDGSVVGFATKMGVAIPFTAITNTNPANITHTEQIVKGAVLAIQSGWAGINNRACVAGEAEGGATELLGIDTTDTQLFIAGRGAGSVFVASDFVDFSQQGELTSSGGEPQTYTGKYLEDALGQEFQVPNGQTARQYALSLDYDPSLPWYAAAKTVTRRKKPTVIRIQLPGGDVVYEYGYVHFNSALNMTSGQPIKNAVTFYLQSSEGTLIEAGA
ncbi:phage tail protein [Alcaligenaceae bacterium 429]|nr:phage tail protein [Alcaligenaceae bacterium 429]